REAHSPKLFYPAVGLKLEELARRRQIAYRLKNNGKFQNQQSIEISKNDEKRSCELAAYFTHLQLQPIYKIMTLKSSLNQAFKLTNYKTATTLPNTLKVLSVCEKNPTDEHPLNYGEYNPFNICAASYVPHLS
ncbi:unnamed protein product, partial [Rotaria sp. Silwood1]